MNDFDCRNELVQRERRGELSDAERLAHAAHLGHCETCRLAQQLGRDFDESTALERGDGARIAALAESARKWAAFGPNGASVRPAARHSGFSTSRVGRSGVLPALPRGRMLVAAAALCLLSAAGASAAFGVFTPPVVQSSPDSGALHAAAARGTASERRVSRNVMLRAEPAPPVHAPTAAAASEAVLPAPPPRAELRQAPESAATLFQRANEARRSGEIGRALALYGELVRVHPSSQEASVSELRVASLLLERGKAGAALAHFDKHLRRAGALVPEALYGRGRALAALDEASRERQT